MTGWIIFAGIVIFITLLMLLPVGVIIRFGEDFVLRLQIAFLSFAVVPAQKKKVRLRDYDIKRIRRKKKRADAKAAKKLKKKRSAAKKAMPEEESEAEKTGVLDMLRLVRLLVLDLKAPFLGYMKVELRQLRIVVAAGDAAATALLYGAVVQAVTYLCEILRNLTGFKVTGREDEIAVIPGFAAEKTTAQVELAIKFQVRQLIALALRFGISYIKNKNSGANKKEEINKNIQTDNGGNENGGQQA